MRSESSEPIYALTAVAAIVLIALVTLSTSDSALAANPAASAVKDCAPANAAKTTKNNPPLLLPSDELFVLKAIHHTLTTTGDGTPFVWRQRDGRLAGLVRPTRSFRTDSGKICRHLVVLLTTGYRTRSVEGIACRLRSGRWTLES